MKYLHMSLYKLIFSNNLNCRIYIFLFCLKTYLSLKLSSCNKMHSQLQKVRESEKKKDSQKPAVITVGS